MNSQICTLFEGDYHYGVGALSNSLYAHGYRGAVWVGYRGKLPPWAHPLEEKEGTLEYSVTDDFKIRFIELRVNAHLTNYKPDFMLDLWRNKCPAADSLFYFDPDIVIKCRWSFFEEWASCGVALSEDVNSPLPSSHPLRRAWMRFYESGGIQLTHAYDLYVNGGFIGVAREQKSFLDLWKKTQELMFPEIGGADKIGVKDRTYLFNRTDQDALNVSLMAFDCPVSLSGKEAMDFCPGGYMMSHAAGGVKPWRKKMFLSALGGVAPGLADKEFWSNVECPIRLYPPSSIAARRFELQLASAVGRFFRRS